MAQPLDVMLEIEPNDIRQHPGRFTAQCRWQERCRRKMTGVGQKYWRSLHRREVVGELPRDKERREASNSTRYNLDMPHKRPFNHSD